MLWAEALQLLCNQTCTHGVVGNSLLSIIYTHPYLPSQIALNLYRNSSFNSILESHCSDINHYNKHKTQLLLGLLRCVSNDIVYTNKKTFSLRNNHVYFHNCTTWVTACTLFKAIQHKKASPSCTMSAYSYLIKALANSLPYYSYLANPIDTVLTNINTTADSLINQSINDASLPRMHLITQLIASGIRQYGHTEWNVAHYLSILPQCLTQLMNTFQPQGVAIPNSVQTGQSFTAMRAYRSSLNKAVKTQPLPSLDFNRIV